MPLRALNNKSNINAFEYDEQSWRLLKSGYRSQDLRLPCCGAEAVPKTSKLGNFFFSHKTRSGCSSAPESAEHIYLKSLIAKAAKESGWLVVTEFSGQSSKGDGWVADVYCEKGSARLALEVQLSYITYETLKLRSDKYKDSGIRAAWFLLNTKFNRGYAQPSKDTPLFKVKKFMAGEIPQMDNFEVLVPEFVDALLNKKVQWKEEPWEYEIHYIKGKCWRCANDVNKLSGYSINTYYEPVMTESNASDVLERLSKFITNEELKALGLNLIGQEKGPGSSYCNVCLHCNSPQNNRNLIKRVKLQRHTSEARAFLSPRESSGAWIFKAST